MSEQGFYAFAQGQPSEHVEWSGDAPLIKPEKWMKDAACRDMDTEIFFPTPGDTYAIKNAIAICESCPVRAFCGEYAARMNEQEGVWDGKLLRPKGQRERTLPLTCKRGHQYTTENTRIRTGGARACRTCDRLTRQERAS